MEEPLQLTEGRKALLYGLVCYFVHFVRYLASGFSSVSLSLDFLTSNQVIRTIVRITAAVIWTALKAEVLKKLCNPHVVQGRWNEQKMEAVMQKLKFAKATLSEVSNEDVHSKYIWKSDFEKFNDCCIKIDSPSAFINNYNQVLPNSAHNLKESL